MRRRISGRRGYDAYGIEVVVEGSDGGRQEDTVIKAA
jgi:hypothetical protein